MKPPRSPQPWQHFLNAISAFWDKLTIPPKHRMVGVASATMFMVIGLDQFLIPHTPLERSLILPYFAPEPVALQSLPPIPEDYVDPDGNPVGRLLTDKERYKISLILGESPDLKSTFVNGPEPPLMILHDTAGQLSREELENRPRYSDSPLGDGIAVYVPREGDAIVTRSAWFTPFRPTATAYEKGLDFMTEPQRNRSLRQVWQAANDRARQQAISAIVNQQVEKPKNLANRAALWFKTGSDRAFDAYLADHPHQVDGGKTTAIWAMGHLCSQVLGQPTQASQWAASPSTVKTLVQSCQAVHPLLQANRTRLAGSFNVELVQMEGSDCFVSSAEIAAFNAIADSAHQLPTTQVIPLQTADRPAYTDNQYEQLARLYLRAALEAGRYPQIVTHYWLDYDNGRKIGSHCDPRGLNLTELYRRIASYLGHSPEFLYGLKPAYGRSPEQGHNVWWSATVMGEEPPSSLAGEIPAETASRTEDYPRTESESVIMQQP